MSPMFVAIAVAYISGKPVEVDAVAMFSTEAECVAAIRPVLPRVATEVPDKIQLEVKCVNYGDVKVAASQMGTKPPKEQQ